MADLGSIAALIQRIVQTVKQNGNQEITGPVLQGVLIDMADTIQARMSAIDALQGITAVNPGNGFIETDNSSPGVASVSLNLVALEAVFAAVDHSHTMAEIEGLNQALALINQSITALQSKEDGLGNPSANGMVLSSLIDGTRSWINQSGGASNLQEAVDGGDSLTDSFIRFIGDTYIRNADGNIKIGRFTDKNPDGDGFDYFGIELYDEDQRLMQLAVDPVDGTLVIAHGSLDPNQVDAQSNPLDPQLTRIRVSTNGVALIAEGAEVFGVYYDRVNDSQPRIVPDSAALGQYPNDPSPTVLGIEPVRDSMVKNLNAYISSNQFVWYGLTEDLDLSLPSVPYLSDPGPLAVDYSPMWDFEAMIFFQTIGGEGAGNLTLNVSPGAGTQFTGELIGLSFFTGLPGQKNWISTGAFPQITVPAGGQIECLKIKGLISAQQARNISISLTQSSGDSLSVQIGSWMKAVPRYHKFQYDF